MRKKSKLVCGIGTNDADYPVYIYAATGGGRKQIWICPFYRAWVNMMKRGYSMKLQARYPTYAGCSVATEWHSFSAFRAWMVAQDHEGKQLDKDILFPGNKVYSQDACVFVPASLNTFMIDCGAARGEWPTGVSLDRSNAKLMVRCSNPFTGKNEYLGHFADPNVAHETWRARKHELACQYADQQTDQRIAQALRQRYRDIK